MPGAKSGAAAQLEWVADRIACIRLTRPERYNTLTEAMLAQLAELHDQAEAGGARAMVITGTGKIFCGGAEITYFTDPVSACYHNARAVRDAYVRPIIEVFRKFRTSSFPTIAAINGHALGGGLEFALSCDFRLLASTARVGLTEVRLGAIPAGGGVQLLSQVVGRAKALEIILLGDQWNAEDAKAAGLVTAVHPPEALEDAAFAFARRFLLCSPISIAEARRAIYRCSTIAPDEADEIALDAVAAAAAGPDWWEGMSAFVEKRPASFRKDS